MGKALTDLIGLIKRSRETTIVRVREHPSPNKWVKKSKFYKAKGPGDARRKYKGNGHVMYVEKVKGEKMFGVGEFFTLGDKLLREFEQESTLAESVRSKEKEKVRGRRELEKIKRGSNG